MTMMRQAKISSSLARSGSSAAGTRGDVVQGDAEHRAPGRAQPAHDERDEECGREVEPELVGLIESSNGTNSAPASPPKTADQANAITLAW